MVYTGFILILLCFFIMLTSFASLEEAKITRFAQAFSSAVNVFDSGSSLEKGETLLHTDALTLDKEDKMARLFQEVKKYTEKEALGYLDIQRSSRGVIVTLADKLLFRTAEAELSPEAYPLLAKIARIIKRIPVFVEIEGHSDDRPIRTAAYPSNWELSTARAVNVLRHLIEQQQVSAHRLSAVGFSMYRPAVKNDSDENRARNRRVAIIFKTN
jgi:chemotaxis protein MotB